MVGIITPYICKIKNGQTYSSIKIMEEITQTFNIGF